MTIIYQYRVATTSLGGFLKLLGAWRGSVYKLLYKETLIFSMLYTAISLTYRLALSPAQKRQMEQVVIHCNSYTSFIPISFVLGFYVTVVVQRWWEQFRNVPWPDRTLFILCTYLNGEEERSRIMRRSVARYMMFGLLLIMRSVSVAVMNRFPTIETIVQAGFISKEEAAQYEATQCRYLKFWVPLMWANNVIARARREGRIETEFGLRMILEQLADFRDKCSLCFVYDWITIPLVYTQVVTLAVYSFFAACLLGRQFLDPERGYPGYEYDSYVPVFTILQFIFYMGWLKVAEQMINPFGEDDDDYDINWLLDRHMAVAFALVDQCCGRHPSLLRDHFWDETVMPEMPYTEASENSRRPNFLGSTFNINHLVSEDNKVPPQAPDSGRLRRRSHGSFAGSVLSLFSFRPGHNRFLSGSRDTIDSGDQHSRFLSVPNGRAGYIPVPQTPTQDKSRSVSLDMTNAEDAVRLAIPERRERSYSERVETADPEMRVRKLSSPSRFSFVNKREPLVEQASPKTSRFVVEPVDDSWRQQQQLVTEGGGTDGLSGVITSTGRTRRTGQHVLAMLQANNNSQTNNNMGGSSSGGGGGVGVGGGGSKAVSRPPLLSAIEEGNTVTSIRQILPPSDSEDTSSVASNDDLFSDITAVSGLEDIHEDNREVDFAEDHVTTVTDHPTSLGNSATVMDDRTGRTLSCQEEEDEETWTQTTEVTSSLSTNTDKNQQQQPLSDPPSTPPAVNEEKSLSNVDGEQQLDCHSLGNSDASPWPLTTKMASDSADSNPQPQNVTTDKYYNCEDIQSSFSSPLPPPNPSLDPCLTEGVNSSTPEARNTITKPNDQDTCTSSHLADDVVIPAANSSHNIEEMKASFPPERGSHVAESVTASLGLSALAKAGIESDEVDLSDCLPTVSRKSGRHGAILLGTGCSEMSDLPPPVPTILIEEF